MTDGIEPDTYAMLGQNANRYPSRMVFGKSQASSHLLLLMLKVKVK